jgi:hypothetical protein
LAVEDDQLLPEQGILSDPLSFSARQVNGRVENKGIVRGLSEMAEGLIIAGE